MRPEKLPFPVGTCGRCGLEIRSPVDWYGSTPAGDPIDVFEIGRMTIECPRCDTDVQLYRPRETIYADIISELRQADLSVDQLVRLGAALATAGPETTVVEIGAQVPKARRLLRMSESLSPGNWIALAGVIVAALVGTAGIMVAHSDAEQARRGTDQPPQVQRTSKLTDEDARELRKHVHIYLQSQDANARGEASRSDQEQGG